ncbi:MAG: S-methyl-5-thioribose-1-phosphate isomerase [Spirochaetaceae bacterium]|nr:MAG: S-methyl-5-thioribose-1-phosphate isomerase [Spirochaetaceae bacterium]
MNIKKTHYTTIWLQDESSGKIRIIDQRFLPFELCFKDIDTLSGMYEAIHDMLLRGAPLIGVAGAFGMYLAIRNMPCNKTKSFDGEYLANAARMLVSSRPTAINLKWAVERVIATVTKGKTIEEKSRLALEEAQKIRQEEMENCRLIGVYGLPLIEKIAALKPGKSVNILTHCNAGWLACIDWGTATAPIYMAHDSGIPVHVWVDETRPRNQGARLTAFELGEHGVPHTVIPDNAGGHLMQHGLVDMVIVGSDRTTRTGDVCNKIGTYLKALAAADNNIPFYVALPRSSIDFSIKNGVEEIPVEERDATEVHYVEGLLDGEVKNVRITPEKSKAANYGFDVTPARLVTGLITQCGICSADETNISRLFPDASRATH